MSATSFVLLQAGAAWRPDLFSLLLGFFVGVLLTIAAIRMAPLLRDYWGRAAIRVQDTQAWVRSSVEHRFQLETLAYVERHHLGGHLATLAEIFVEPRLLAPPPEADPEEPDTGSNPEELHYSWPGLTVRVGLPPPPTATLRQLLLNGRRTLIAGEQGMGKTTLLAYCAHLCAHENENGPYTFFKQVVPIFLHLADLQLDAPQLADDPVWALSQPLIVRSNPLTAPGVDKLLHDKLAAGQALLLLDGLDEAPPERITAVADWLARIFNLYPDIRFLAAVPPQGYGPLLALGCHVSGILPWRMGQADQFGQKWGAALGKKPLRRAQYWQPGIGPLAASLRLWQRLTEAEQPGAAVSSGRQIELLEARLLRHLPSNPTDPEWLAPAVRDLWQEMAYRLRRDSQLRLSSETALEIMLSILQAYQVEERQSVGLLQKSVTASNLFVAGPNNSLRFLSPLWRDFLAAAYMAQSQLSDEATERLADPHWRRLLFFYVGRVGLGGLADQMLNAKRNDPLYEDLFQLTSWLPELLDKGEWRRQVLLRLGQMVVKSNLPYALRHRAALALAQCGESGVPAFINQLARQPDPALRQTAVACLGVLGVEAALPLLEKMIEDNDPAVRRTAVHTLGWLSDPAAEKPLLTALVDKDNVLNQAAAEALALNGPEGFQILQEALGEETLHIRRAAVYGLAGLDDYDAVLLLETTEREDEQWIIKSSAQAALQLISARNRYNPWRVATPGDQSWLISWSARHGQTVPGGRAALPMLLKALSDAGEETIRATAALSLARMSLSDGLPALRTALRDPAAPVREAAFVALCQIHRAHQNAFQP